MKLVHIQIIYKCGTWTASNKRAKMLNMPCPRISPVAEHIRTKLFMPSRPQPITKNKLPRARGSVMAGTMYMPRQRK
jgi:hypothetical protein